MSSDASLINIAHSLFEVSRQRPDAIALIDLDASAGPKVFDYAALWSAVADAAASFRSRGLVPNDRVALLLANSWEYVVAFFGAVAAGCVVAPLNVRLLGEELEHMLRDSGTKLLVAQRALLDGKDRLEGIPPGGTIFVRPAESGLLDREAPSRPTDTAPVARQGADLASLMYTSGTTGAPKGVMLPHRAWRAVGDFAIRCLNYGPSEVTLHAAPLTHGSGFLMLPTFSTGGTNVIISRFEPARVLRILEEQKITNGFFVPSMIRMLLDARMERETAPPSLKTIYYAGAPIDRPTLTQALSWVGGHRMVQSFAQMESPMFLTVLDRQDHCRIADGGGNDLIRSAGKPLPGVGVRILDESGAEAPKGAVGEIVARAPQCMLGYWNRRDATDAALRDGWLHTGDLGYFDDSGYLFVIDRKKDMIISGGSNVYAREVEEALLRHENVAEAAVIGLPHEKWGEEVVAVLVSRSGRPTSDEAMRSFCRAALPDFRRPKRFLWIDALPKNAYGKTLKRDLRITFGGQSTGAAAR